MLFEVGKEMTGHLILQCMPICRYFGYCS